MRKFCFLESLCVRPSFPDLVSRDCLAEVNSRETQLLFCYALFIKLREILNLRERMMWMEEIRNEEHIVIHEECLIS